MSNLAAIKADCAKRWAACQIVPKRLSEVVSVSKRLCAPSAKQRYQRISQTVWGTPDRWWFVAIVHERESGQDFGTQLGQGDPLGQVSRHVPRGMGPYFNHPNDPPGEDAFYRGAVDALMNAPPYAARWTDWTAAGALTLLVTYNGTGYYDFHNECSPYDWGATDQEEEGKYVGDGRWALVWDTQVGCAAMLKQMMVLDPSIRFDA